MRAFLSEPRDCAVDEFDGWDSIGLDAKHAAINSHARAAVFEASRILAETEPGSWTEHGSLRGPVWHPEEAALADALAAFLESVQ